MRESRFDSGLLKSLVEERKERAGKENKLEYFQAQMLE